MVNREKIRKLYNINEKTTVLGHVGKIYKPKNHHFIISVFNDYHAQNPDSKLLLVGDGIMREEIEKDVNGSNSLGIKKIDKIRQKNITCLSENVD